jgi:hypothetical protein
MNWVIYGTPKPCHSYGTAACCNDALLHTAPTWRVCRTARTLTAFSACVNISVIHMPHWVSAPIGSAGSWSTRCRCRRPKPIGGLRSHGQSGSGNLTRRTVMVPLLRASLYSVMFRPRKQKGARVTSTRLCAAAAGGGVCECQLT